MISHDTDFCTINYITNDKFSCTFSIQLSSIILKQYVEAHWCHLSEKFRPPETTPEVIIHCSWIYFLTVVQTVCGTSLSCLTAAKNSIIGLFAKVEHPGHVW